MDNCKCDCCKPQYKVIKRIWLDNDVKLEPGTIIPDEIIEKIKDSVHLRIWLSEGMVRIKRPYLEDCRNNALEVLENDTKYNDIDSEVNEILKAYKEYYDYSYNKNIENNFNCSDDVIFEVPEDSEIYLLNQYKKCKDE